MVVSYPVLHRLPIRLFLLSALSASTVAHAAEHITLNSGFTVDCVRHEAVETGRVRLIFDAAGTKTQEISAQLIAAIETVPDPPPPALTHLGAPRLVSETWAGTTQRPEAPDVPTLLAHAGAQHNIDAELLASIVHAESGGRTRAVSRTGARGLMQLMPATARDLGVADAFEPGQNIDGGTAYLDALLIRYDAKGDRHGLDLAIAAYNAGPAAVDRYHGVPPYRETRAYVVRVEREFARRKAAAKPSTLASLR